MSANHSLGRWGEDAARRFLESCGFKCLDQRFRRPGGEIDLVMTQDSLVVFVEVKTRGPRCPVPPEAWVTPVQLRRLRRMAAVWRQENPGTFCRGFRFDVVAVSFGGREGGSRIHHLVGVG